MKDESVFGFECIMHSEVAYNIEEAGKQSFRTKTITLKPSSLAQSVEHLTVNQGVVGSSPTGGAKMECRHNVAAFLI